jgi:hypothetical protein
MDMRRARQDHLEDANGRCHRIEAGTCRMVQPGTDILIGVFLRRPGCERVIQQQRLKGEQEKDIQCDYT